MLTLNKLFNNQQDLKQPSYLRNGVQIQNYLFFCDIDVFEASKRKVFSDVVDRKMIGLIDDVFSDLFFELTDLLESA